MNQANQPGGIDHWARPPKARKQRSEFLAILVVLAVVVGIWLLNGRDPGTPTAEPLPAESSASASESVSAPGSESDPESGLPTIDVAALPPEARDVLQLIDQGGPFRYEKDGSRFGNFEGLLPDEPDGYYAEYTVDTPGSSDRGARRIVAGDRDEFYWTEDHYDSFERIVR